MYILISDTHFGVRNENKEFHDNMELFFAKVFFPFISENINHITKVIHLGDVFDNRKRIDIRTAELARKYFFTPLKDMNIHMDIIAGNHDVYYREYNDTNTLKEFVSQVYDNVTVYDRVADVDGVLYVPWINKNNKEETIQHILSTDSKYVMGHLELAGFNFSKVQVASHGDDPSNFKRFEKVMSGHYHYPHSKGNIHYLGSPTEHTWIDVNTKRGFHVFEPNNGSLTLIENPYNIFQNVEFNSIIEGSHRRFYRLSVDETIPKSDVDQKIKQLTDSGAIDVKVVQNKNTDVVLGSNEDEYEVEDTPKFINSVVNDKELSNLLINLYNESVGISV